MGNQKYVHRFFYRLKLQARTNSGSENNQTSTSNDKNNGHSENLSDDSRIGDLLYRLRKEAGLIGVFFIIYLFYIFHSALIAGANNLLKLFGEQKKADQKSNKCPMNSVFKME